MKAHKLLVLFASLATVATTPADASLYDISFNDGIGNIGHGKLDIETTGENSHAAFGFLDVTSGDAIGSWTLYTAGGTQAYPGYFTSPSGSYWYNNSVYPDGNNPQYPDTNPFLDYYGLLFTQPNGNELNLWGNSDGTYTLGGDIGGKQNFRITINFEGTTFTPDVTPVPEPSTMIACMFLLVPIGATALRYLRKTPLQR